MLCYTLLKSKIQIACVGCFYPDTNVLRAYEVEHESDRNVYDDDRDDD